MKRRHSTLAALRMCFVVTLTEITDGQMELSIYTYNTCALGDLVMEDVIRTNWPGGGGYYSPSVV
jgi:hypothetical protein